MQEKGKSMLHDRIVRLIEGVPGVRRKVEDGSRLVEDLGFDSIKMVELMGTVEDEFNLIITLDDATSVSTVADLKSMVREAMQAQGVS